MRWPESFDALKLGVGCEICANADVEDNGHGLRYMRGNVADAYLQRQDVSPGYSVVAWKLRHVTEPTELSTAEASAYFGDVLAAARILELHFEPVKTNYQTLGNAVPHLHTHIILRFADDPRPGGPFPWPSERHLLPEDQVRSTAQALKTAARRDAHTA